MAALVASSVVAVTLMLAAPAGAQPTNWAVMASPNPAAGNALNSVACVSASSCVAVGAQGSGVEQTLIETLTGSTWAVTPSPDVQGGERDVLSAVSCVSAGSCVAVGHYVNSTGIAQTLIETLAGGTWTITPSPNLGGGVANSLLGVSCYHAGSCVAVGYSGNGGGTEGSGDDQTLIETLTGGSWSITQSPDSTPVDANDLRAVSCTSDGTCTAVGRYYTGNGANEQTLVLNATGSGAWTQASTSFQASGSDLYGVSCVSDNACESAGDQLEMNGTLQTLIEDYTQGSWNADNTPNLGGGDNALRGVSCIGPTDCVAVGYATGSLSQTLVQDYSGGGSWDTVPSPNTGTAGNALSGVSCVSGECIAVGTAGADTLVEIGTGSDVVPAVVTRGTSAIKAANATAHGTVNPRGADSHYYVEYGTSRAYGKTTSPRDAGSGKLPVAVSVRLSRLKPGTTYHYRLVAQSNGGIAYGADKKFKTHPAPLKCSLSLKSEVIVKPPAGSATSGAVSVKVKCSAAAHVSVKGSITSGKHRKPLRLAPASASLRSSASHMLTLTVPRAVLAALLAHARESLSASLAARGSGGADHVSATVGRLKLSTGSSGKRHKK